MSGEDRYSDRKLALADISMAALDHKSASAIRFNRALGDRLALAIERVGAIAPVDDGREISGSGGRIGGSKSCHRCRCQKLAGSCGNIDWRSRDRIIAHGDADLLLIEIGRVAG